MGIKFKMFLSALVASVSSILLTLKIFSWDIPFKQYYLISIDGATALLNVYLCGIYITYLTFNAEKYKREKEEAERKKNM